MSRNGLFGASTGVFCLVGVAAFACSSERDFGDEPHSGAQGGKGAQGGQGGEGGEGQRSGGGGLANQATGGSAGAEPGIGTVGEPCAFDAAFACAGHNQRTQLLCKDGEWVVQSQCAANERCDTRASNAGACEPMVPECVGKEPGQGACRGSRRFDCGLDSVTEESAESCDALCVEHVGKAECSLCDAGKYTDSPGSCADWSSCDAGKYISQEGSATTDRECASCAEGSYSTAQNAASCTEWTTCTWRKGGLQKDGTQASDAVCGTPSAYRQFGTEQFDSAAGVAVATDGSVYVVGATAGTLSEANAGEYDAYLRKYAADGNLLWTKQFGGVGLDSATGVTVASDGSVYVVGSTAAALSEASQSDAYVRKFKPDGTLDWYEPFGTVSQDSAKAVALDADGNVYVVGETYGALAGSDPSGSDAYVRKFAQAEGSVLWTQQFHNDYYDEAVAVAVDHDGNVYVAGNTWNASQDAFVRKYTTAGAAKWTKLLGTADTYAKGVAVDADGNVYLAGYTGGALDGENAGNYDAFVRKYDAGGTVLWTEQFGTSSYDEASAITMSGSGNVYVVGSTEGDLSRSRLGFSDGFVREYAADGSAVWTEQFGSTFADFAYGVAASGSGDLYVAGATEGALSGVSSGSSDAYVAKIER